MRSFMIRSSRPARAIAIVAIVAGSGVTSGTSAAAAEKPKHADDVTVVDIAMGPVYYTPKTVFVTAGKKVRFRFTNNATVVHEALIGDAKAQAAHGKLMKEMGEHMSHMKTKGMVSVAGGKTATLDWTFTKPGRTLIGCHQPGHYKNMVLNVVIKNPAGIA